MMIHTGILLALLISPVTVFAQGTQQPSSIPRPAGADTINNPAIDPTRNVLDLVAAAIQRQDDLRATQDRILILRSEASERLNMVRFEQAKELSVAQDRRIDEIARLRAEYAERLAVAEAKRIDAIRAVDVNAVAVANQRTSEQATALQTQTTASAEVLRNQVARSAEDLRALVATTAATALNNQQQQFSALSIRITTLEQAGSESRGSARFQDPAIAALSAEVRKLMEARSTVYGVSQGQGDMVGWIIGGLMFIFSLIGAITAVIVVTKQRPANSRAR